MINIKVLENAIFVAYSIECDGPTLSNFLFIKFMHSYEDSSIKLIKLAPLAKSVVFTGFYDNISPEVLIGTKLEKVEVFGDSIMFKNVHGTKVVFDFRELKVLGTDNNN